MTSLEQSIPPSPWAVESLGLEPVPSSDRYGGSQRLFWVWFAGNLSFAYLVIGAVVWSYGLSLWQSILAIGIGVAAFWMIGYLGLPGHRTGLPTMAYSARYFGARGNRVMASVSWLNMLGWETVVLVIATYAVATMLHLLLGVPTNAFWLLLSLALSASLELSIAFFGHALIEAFQQWISYVFGLLTLFVLVAFLPHIEWHAVLTRPTGPWLDGVIPAITIVIAVSALSWVTTASDYTRHLPASVSKPRIVRATTWGSLLPTGTMMLVGLLLSTSAPNLSSAINPIELLLKWMPSWAEMPYLLVTAVGIIAGGVLCAYSSGLSLLAAGIRIPRSRTIGVDAVVSLGASLYVILVSQQFLGSFEAFLSLIAALLAPWAAIALVNVVRSPRASSPAAIAAWVVGASLSLATTATSIFVGPLAVGIFRLSSLGYFLGFLVALLIYTGWARLERANVVR